MLCTAPRSGSTLLCRLLAATGVAGNPASYFYDPTVEEWLSDLGLAAEAGASGLDRLHMVVGEVLRRGRAGTGLFGLRQQATGRAFLCAQLAHLAPQETTEAGRIRVVFGPTLFLHLTRSDKVAQAVSLLKARQTGLWHQAPDGSDLERTAPHQDPAYDPEAIRACVADLTRQDQDWTTWFQREGITPLCLTYADLSADPLTMLRHVLDHLGLDPAAADGVTPGTRKLADSTSADWVERFRGMRDQ